MPLPKNPHWSKLAVEVVNFNNLDETIIRPTSGQTFEDWFDNTVRSTEKTSGFCTLIAGASGGKMTYSCLFQHQLRQKRESGIPDGRKHRQTKPKQVVTAFKGDWFSSAISTIRAGLQPGESAEVVVTVTASIKKDQN